MRASREAAGPSSASGWSDVAEGEPRPAAIPQSATRQRRAAFDQTATVGQPAALDENRRSLQAPLDDAPLQAGATIGPHAPFHAMTQIGVTGGLHVTNL